MEHKKNNMNMGMTKNQQRYIELQKLPEREKVKEFFLFIDELKAEPQNPENIRILSYLYSALQYWQTAYEYFAKVADIKNLKDTKKLYQMQDMSERHANRFGVKRPCISKDKVVPVQLPVFKYCSDPLKAKLFEIVEDAEMCQCCGKDSKILYKGPFYARENVDVLCPDCIATGKAAQQYNGEFIDSAGVSLNLADEYIEELCLRTPSYTGWQQEYWPDHCEDFCDFIGYVGWTEIEEMELETSVEYVVDTMAEYKETIVNGGSCQGYLFRCLKCNQYVLYTDCD